MVVILDDAYFGLLYEQGLYEESLFAELSSLHENVLAVKVDGATKEDFAWGYRVGFITFGGLGLTKASLEALESKAAGAVRGLVSNCCHMSQSLLSKAYGSRNYEAEKRQKFDVLKRRHTKAKSILSRPKYAECFTMLPCNSGYFLCLQAAPGVDAELVRQKLLHDYSTGTISIGSDLFRIAFSSLPEAKIEEFVENLYAACVVIKNKTPTPVAA
jgi:aspartate/methionine/tyrosine aminotransferase